MIVLLWRGAIGVFFGALFGLAALALGYARHPAITLEMDRGASSVVSGLYDTERVDRETFAWTRRNATMSLPGLDRTAEWACTIRMRGGRADESTLPQVVIAVDGLRTGADALDAMLERTPAGRTVKVHAFRRDELLACDVTLEPAPPDTAYLALDAAANAEQLQRRSQWLGM